MKLKQASKEEMKILYAILTKIVFLHKKQRKQIKIRIRGKEFWIYPNVFNPKYGKASTLLLKHLKFRKKSTVLDIGTGSGIYAIFSVYNGASKVVATDISPYAIQCAKKNIRIHHMEDKIEVRKGDMFAPIMKRERFDVIVANPPFFKKDGFDLKKSYIEKFFIDEKGRIISSLIRNGRRHLNENGKILIVYGVSGFVNELLRLIKRYNYKYKILETRGGLDKFYVLELKLSKSRR